jgi:hypothetical protein
LSSEPQFEAYASGELSFVPQLHPGEAVALPAREVLGLLRRRLGRGLELALAPEQTDPDAPPPSPDPLLRGPVADQPDGRWLGRARMVGINLRTTGSLFGAVKYALTLPAVQDAIHLLPIWEPGVVESLYGPCSWELNDEFFSAELAAEVPHLDSTGRQLRAVVNLLHAGGRAVGMDVITHTDRFSQMSLAFPEHFEWLRRDGQRITDHRADLHLEVQQQIAAFVAQHGPAVPTRRPPETPAALFGADVPEAARLRVLFGEPADAAGREARRIALVKHLHGLGYEPLPATMGPPYRGLELDPARQAAVTDEHGMQWRDYRITEPQAFSRAFGPLARYKLYERLEDNARWQIDFDRPREAVWRYVCEHYAEVQRRFGFDFMRGDMSHVQMRPAGVPDRIDEHYDLLRAVKRHIRQAGARHFGYHAESFLAPPDTMAHGDELDHLEASEADSALGDLQSLAVGTPEFLQQLRRYLDLLQTRRVAPCFSVMTADKDDPRFDRFYLAGNALRMFVALLLPEMPSYVGLGFEVRDPHPEPAPNEHYSKLYVFQERRGPKATSGPYVWGHNAALLDTVTRLRLLAERLGPELRGRAARWLLPPDPTAGSRVLCWTLDGRAPSLLFVANADTAAEARNLGLPLPPGREGGPAALEFSSDAELDPADHALGFNGVQLRLARLGPGECRVYRL